MNAIELNKLQKTFSEGKVALDHLSLTVPEGKIFGFLGPNGAGKTTTVKLLTGILTPTSGDARVFNLDPIKEAEKIHQFSGVLTEHAGMYDHISGIDNLCFFGQLFGMSKEDSKKRGLLLLEKLGLAEAAAVKLKNYSTGMRQRLSLARTLIHQPKLLFLDEPTSGLDPESTKSVNELLLELAKNEGTTIFLCTHQLRYAQEICSEYGLMDNGQLLAIGSLEQLRRQAFNTIKLLIETDYMPEEIQSQRIGDGLYEMAIFEKDEIPKIVKKIVDRGGNISQVILDDYSLEDIYFALLKGAETHV